MNLKQLEYFVQVAELGSFSKAARVLGIAQPALSRQVRLLETDLRATLLLRNGRGVALTDPGKRLLEHGVDILQRVTQAREDIVTGRDEPVGRVVVGLPPTLARQLTLPMIEAFRERLPRAQLAVVEGLSAHIAEWTTTGRVDLGVLYNPEPQPGLEASPLFEEPLVLVEKAAGELGRVGAAPRTATVRRRKRVAASRPGRAVRLRDLPRLRLILPERAHTFRRLLETQAAHAGIRLDVAWEVSSVPTIVDLVCAGHGCAVLTASAVAASPRAGELVVRPIVEPSIVSVLCVATSAHRRLTPLGRRVLELLGELTSQLAAGPRARRR